MAAGTQKRPARVLIGMLGMDQHEVGAIAVAGMLMEAGMEVIYTGRFNTPDSLVNAALSEDVDVIGISVHSWEYIDYLPDLQVKLNEAELDVPLMIGGSILTPGDRESLQQKGIAATFPAGAGRDEIIQTVERLAGLN